MQRVGTILIVDDDPDIQGALQTVLEDCGYDVVVAQNGREALAWVGRNEPPACILLDLMMPVMNGWDFALAVEQDPRLRRVPVLVLTAAAPHWGTPDRADRTLRKPIDLDRLLETVRSVLCAGASAGASDAAAG
jgi:CheY-like chemotaxis protein